MCPPSRHHCWLAANPEQVLSPSRDKDKSPTVDCGSTLRAVAETGAILSCTQQRQVDVGLIDGAKLLNQGSQFPALSQLGLALPLERRVWEETFEEPDK